MKKEKMITRTFTRTNFDMMQVNTNTCEVSIIEISLDADFKTDSDLLKHCQSIYETNENKVVKVDNIKKEELLIGISVSDFYKYGTILPPRPLSQQKGYKKPESE